MKNSNLLFVAACLFGVLGLAFDNPQLSSASPQSGDLPAPSQRRVVVHGVELDWQHGTVDGESAPLLDEALASMDERGPAEVIVLTEPALMAGKQDTAARVCGATIVREYLAQQGVSLARLMSVTIPPPGSALPSAPTSDGAALCRVGFVVK